MTTSIVAEATRGIKQELRAGGGDVPVAGPSRKSNHRGHHEKKSDSIAYDSRGRIQYLQPKDAPAYDPTPIEELKKMKRENEDPQFSPTGSEDEEKPSFMPHGLSQIATLNPPSSSSPSLRKVSKPSTSFQKSNLLLPDISDDSDEEEGAKESSDVVGSILMKGMKTGVFNNVDEFQHELIKNKMRMKEKRLMKNKEKDAAAADAAPADVKLEKNISCNTVSSSSEEVKEREAKDSKMTVEEPKETEEEKKDRLEREEAKRLVEQRERELEKLEEKRKMLETFYKNRQLSIDSNMPPSKKKPEEEVTVLTEQSWAKEPSQTIVISSDGGGKRSPRSSYDSEQSSSDDEHRRRRRRSKKHHRSGSGSRKRSRSESGRRRHKKRRKRRRRRSRSTSSTSPSSSSGSSSSYEERSRKKKRRKRRRSSRSSKSSRSGEKDRKRRRTDDKQPFPSVAAVMAEVNRKPEILSAAAGSVPIKLEANKHLKPVPPKDLHDRGASTRIKNEPPDIKIKKEAPEKKVEDNKQSEDDEDLPENVKSFLDVMNELDEANKIRPKKSIKKECQKPKDKKRDAISFKSEVKKEHRKKERRESTESKSNGKSHHRGHHDKKSSSHSTKKHSDTSKHKSSSKKSSKEFKETSEDAPTEEMPAVEKPKSQVEDAPEKKKSAVSGGGGSPVPDFSAELDMLPDDLDDYGPDDQGAVGENDDGGGDGFFSDDDDDEDDELRRIFDAYEPEPKADADAAGQRKAQKLEAAAKARDAEVGARAEVPAAQSKKRVARDGAEERKTSAKHRPPPPPRSKKLAPSQILMQRYRSIQTKKEDDDLEAKLSEITEGASSKKRVAHGFKYEPDRAKSKLQRQLDARREATESLPGQQTVGHNIKGMPRLAHAPTAKTLQRLEKPLIATDLSARVPSNVRQRYLDSIVEECIKVYRFDKARAYERATKEEESCNARSKSRNIYLNVVVNCIKKLRAEAAEAMKKPIPSSSSSTSATAAAQNKPRPNMLTTHMQTLAGKAGTVGTWSIEKPKKEEYEITPDLTYTILKRYLLTTEQLEENCYPIPDPSETGKAVVKEDPWRPKGKQPTELDKRACNRCLGVYRIDKTGRQLMKEECVYHWGRLYRRKGNRGTVDTEMKT